jgi:hypothetical protein
MVKQIGMFSLFIFLALSVFAQHEGIEYERFIIPIVPAGPIPGAFGSEWQATLMFTNDADTVVSVYPYNWPCSLPGCFSVPPRIPPAATWRVDTSVVGFPTAYIFVERSHSDQVRFLLRAQDLSRQALTWGTQIPMARERDFVDRLSLIDVPTDDRFRTMLRIYGLDGVRSAHVKVFGIRPQRSSSVQVGVPVQDDLLHEETFALFENASNPALSPTIAQIPLDTHRFATHTTLRLEVTTPGSGGRIWAFASITHNETQHLTVISPR